MQARRDSPVHVRRQKSFRTKYRQVRLLVTWPAFFEQRIRLVVAELLLKIARYTIEVNNKQTQLSILPRVHFVGMPCWNPYVRLSYWSRHNIGRPRTSCFAVEPCISQQFQSEPSLQSRHLPPLRLSHAPSSALICLQAVHGGLCQLATSDILRRKRLLWPL